MKASRLIVVRVYFETAGPGGERGASFAGNCGRGVFRKLSHSYTWPLKKLTHSYT